MKVMIVEETIYKFADLETLIPEHNLIKAGEFRYKITQYPTVTVLETYNREGQWIATNHYGKLYVRSEIGIDLFVYEHNFSKTPILSLLSIKPRRITDIYFTKKGPHLLLNIEGDTVEECKVYIVIDGARNMKMFSTMGDAIDAYYHPMFGMFGDNVNNAVYTQDSTERFLKDYIQDSHVTTPLRISYINGSNFDRFSRSPSIDLIEGKFIELTEPLD